MIEFKKVPFFLPAKTEASNDFATISLLKNKGGYCMENNKSSIMKGIDKIKLCNLQIEKIDLAFLEKQKKAEVSYSENYNYMNKIKNGYKIVIKDNEVFSDLVILNNYPMGDKTVNCVKLTLCVKFIKENNIQPLTYTEYNTQIEKIIRYIEEKYKIRLITQNMELDYLELNMNMKLKHTYRDYARPIELIMSFIPLRQNKVMVSSKNNKPDDCNYSKSNNSIEHTFYLKKPPNQNTIDVDILRYEIRFKTKKKIKYDFGTAKWNELNDTVLDEYLKKQTDGFIKKYNKWLEDSEKWVIDAIKKIKKEIPRGHMLQLITEILDEELNNKKIIVLDKNQIYKAIDKTKDKNSTRMKKDINNHIRYKKTASKNLNDIFSNNSIAKAEEVIEFLNKLSQSSLTS
ncbi:MAG: hypothetical protein IJ141_09735 [Lachnospiraceae bacterium]|nr:hypothetical protein [Lachnospiraceae bacterium]